MEADGSVADGIVAPTPFNRCQENSICERHLNQLRECVFFAGGFVAIQHEEQGHPSRPANQLDAILFLNQNRAYLYNMHHPRVVVESRG